VRGFFCFDKDPRPGVPVRGIIRRKLIYNQIFKLPFSEHRFSHFRTRACVELEIRYSLSGGRGAKKAKFCGAIITPLDFSPVKHTYLSLETYRPNLLIEASFHFDPMLGHRTNVGT
jgi:hypothetical protein